MGLIMTYVITYAGVHPRPDPAPDRDLHWPLLPQPADPRGLPGRDLTADDRARRDDRPQDRQAAPHAGQLHARRPDAVDHRPARRPRRLGAQPPGRPARARPAGTPMARRPRRTS